MTNNSIYNGLDNTPPSASYSSYYTQYRNNPETTASWTWADLNSLQAGADMQGWNGGDQAGYRCRLTQVYAIANYTKNATTTATTTQMVLLTTGDIEKVAINATTTQIGAGLDGTKYITQSIIQINFLLVVYFFFIIFILIAVIFFFLNKLSLNKKK